MVKCKCGADEGERHTSACIAKKPPMDGTKLDMHLPAELLSPYKSMEDLFKTMLDMYHQNKLLIEACEDMLERETSRRDEWGQNGEPLVCNCPSCLKIRVALTIAKEKK